MYLKSLTLKGFKSFANKTTLDLERGITCIVGPNGSGKSNISDAILWVLGERSAKNIRGDEMEDVIFSGTKDKKRALLAEVSLVLDNSDQTLKIDFTDVEIMRRMYRSGESEFLLNGTKVRRSDIIEILSSSGLGSQTHSIISQGALDSILSLNEYELRDVIEETAGVLQYKQRKKKSLRKLDKLSDNLKRIEDITLEVDRQLKPLLRKAKKAENFLDLKAKANETKLILAVDDYKKLVEKRSFISSSVNSDNEKIKKIESEVVSVDKKIDRLTDEIKKINFQANKQNEQINAFSSKCDRLNLTSRLVAQSIDSALSMISNSKSEIESINAELESLKNNDIKEKLNESKNTFVKLDADRQLLESEKNEIDKTIAEEEKLLKEKRESQSQTSSFIQKNKEKLSEINALLVSKKAHVDLLKSRLEDVEDNLKKKNEDLNVIKLKSDSLKASLGNAKDRDVNSKNILSECLKAKNEVEKALSDAKSQKKSLDAQIDALSKISMNQELGKNAAKFVQNSKILNKKSMLFKLISVDREYEDFVENIIGDSLDAFVVDESNQMEQIAKDLKTSDCNQSLGLLIKNGNNTIYKKNGLERLFDKIKCDSAVESIVKQLVGDIYICNNIANANDLIKNSKDNIRFLTRDGHFIGNRGDVILNVNCRGEKRGVLQREREIEDLKTSLKSASKNVENLTKSADEAYVNLQEAQTNSILAAENLSKVMQQLDRTSQEVATLEKEVGELNSKKEQLESNLIDENEYIQSSHPTTEELEEKIASLQKNEDALVSQIASLNANLTTYRLKNDDVTKKLGEKNVAASSLSERISYFEQLVSSKEMQVEKLEERLADKKTFIFQNEKNIELKREIVKLIEAIYNKAQKMLLNIQSTSGGKSSKSTEIYDEISRLREESLSLRSKKDEIFGSLSNNKVSLAKIEIEINGKVRVIEVDCKTKLVEAMCLKTLKNREEVELKHQEYNKKIQGLGNIDFDAKYECEKLKERYDFLSKQLDDIRYAISAIYKIDNMIEERFRCDFDKTIKCVRENFSEIFSTLFPGGRGNIIEEKDEKTDEIKVRIEAKPAGKKIHKISLMSGGERSLVALSFLFALYSARHTPFYILDEVEAALDDTNLDRMLAYINKMRNDTQFIMITHQRSTMEMADVLFGISMNSSGVTQVISQRLSVV